MEFSVNEVVMNKWDNKGVITRVDEDEIYVLWETGICGVSKETDLYKTGKRMDIAYFLRILEKR